MGKQLAKIIGDETCTIYHSPLLRTVQTTDAILEAFDPVRVGDGCMFVSLFPFVLVVRMNVFVSVFFVRVHMLA